LSGLGRTGREADDIANLSFIAGRTNRRISDKSPSDYMPRILEQAGPAIFDAQCIPHEDPLYEPSNYDQFLARRRELIADRLNAFLGTDGADISGSNSDPYVRDLDTQVEQVELGIRDFITTQLDADTTLLPRHISDKLHAKISDAARKNPAAATHPTALHALLQYSDFRELQDIVTAKTLWDRFELAFGTKENFNMRCGQLAELRNTIRHSRPMNDVTRKDGEAALRWFRQVLLPNGSDR
jgi:hypothetical protein